MHVLFDSDAFVSETLAMEKELRSVEVLDFLQFWCQRPGLQETRKTKVPGGRDLFGILGDERDALWVGN